MSSSLTMNDEGHIKILPKRKSKSIAQTKIKSKKIIKKRKPKSRISPRQTDLDKKYDDIYFEPLEFNTFRDFQKLIMEKYLSDIPCIQYDKYCVNYKERSKLWCFNNKCKGLSEEFIKLRVQKLWHIHEAGLRIEKPCIFLGRVKEELKSPIKMKIQKVPLKKVNIPWCFVCGMQKSLIKCDNCTASYHKVCHSPKNTINSSCPQCKINCQVPTDGIVWHKMGRYPWWPARLIQLKMRPTCLKRPPSVFHSSVQYFGTNDFAFVDVRELCKFEIVHNPELQNITNKSLLEAFNKACEAFKKDINYGVK